MKIKNIAFFGVMASILGLGVARADDNQIIASKAYVDAKVDANTQEQADFSTLDTTAKTYIKNKPNLAEVSEAGKAIVAVSQSNGQVAASTGTIGSAGLANSAVTTTKINDGAVTFEKLASTAVITSTPGLASDVASASDSAVPTEKAVRAAINNITVDQRYDGTSTHAQAGKAVAEALGTLDVAVTSGATGATKGTVNQADKGKAIIAITQTDGFIDPVLGQVGSAGIADSAVTTDKIADTAVTEGKIANSAVTTNKIADTAVTEGKIASNAVTTGKISNGTIKFEDLNSSDVAATSIRSTGAVDTKLATEKAVADALTSDARQSDWAQTTTTAADYIKNKPTIAQQGTSTKNIINATNNSGTTDAAKAEKALYDAGASDTILVSGKVVKTAFDSLANVAKSGNYDDLTNKPTIPTVNNATLTVTQNGTSAGTFTANQSTAGTIEIKAPDWTAAAGTAGEIKNKPTINTGTLSSSSTTTLASEKTIYDAIQTNAVTGTYNSDTTYDSGTIGGAIQSIAGGSDIGTATKAAATDELIYSVTTNQGKVSQVLSKKVANANVATNANIDYSKMNKGLPNINNAVNTDGSSLCTAANPCVLSYNGSNYSWTNMDTEGVNAQTANP